ncbi:MAG: DUF2489 domain-containing protein [Oceanospirillales bacterium]|nr:MAG: DUF2489 domain-containing protein [Oceanospirillales bacterium]
MSQTLIYSLIIIFVILSIGLAFLIWKLFTQQQLKKRQQALSVIAHANAAQEQKNYLVDSIRIISRSMVDGQCPLTEGCIRLKVLIDNYSPQLHQQSELQVIELMYTKTTHIPTLDAWKSLPSKDKLIYQKEIDSLEQEHAEVIRIAARFLKEYPFEQRVH